MTPGKRLLAGLLALFAANPAAAQQQCAPIRALVNMTGDAMRDLRVGFVGNDGMGLFVGDERASFLPATDCELSTAFGEQRLDCQWRFDSVAEAEGFFNTAAATLRGCTRLAPETPEVEAGEQGWAVRRRHRWGRDGNGVATQVTLDRVEYRTGANEVEHRVTLESVIAPY